MTALKKKFGVLGVGRLGLCFALLLDKAGYKVIGCDIRSSYISALKDRKISTTEPHVLDMLKESKIEFTTDAEYVVSNSDVIYIMVATPSLADGSYDVSAIDRIVDDVLSSKIDLSNKWFVIGCTTNPGYCAKVQSALSDRGVKVLYNPEFIAQGSIIRDLQQADMVLIGGEDNSVIEQYKAVYNEIQIIPPNVHSMQLTSAELVKIAINCFLTTKISYANMVGEVLIRSGMEGDVTRALEAIGSDSRIGHKYMRYGFGFGGPCLPRDNRAFACHAETIGLDFPLGSLVDEFNREHTNFLVQRAIFENKSSLPFFVPYMTYKPNTDILDESQQYAFVLSLLEKNCSVVVGGESFLPKQLVSSLKERYPNLSFEGEENVFPGSYFRIQM